MLLYIDFINKIIYIMAPKCGSTTIAKMLNIDLHTKYSDVELENLMNPEYKKIIILRKSVVDRFLSGFYEDLFNNTCYDNMNVTFEDYLLFLQECFEKKIPNVNKINILNEEDIPVWFGNDSGYTLSITDENGDFRSHIMTQKYAIKHITDKIQCKNVQLIDLHDLSSILPLNVELHNVKEKLDNLPSEYVDISNIILSKIKSNRIIISSKLLNEEQQKIITNIYEEDLIFFKELEEKFVYNNTQEALDKKYILPLKYGNGLEKGNYWYSFRYYQGYNHDKIPYK
jgi:hypothetical protein